MVEILTFCIKLMATGETRQLTQNLVPRVVIPLKKQERVNVTILNLETGVESVREKTQKLQTVTFQIVQVRSICNTKLSNQSITMTWSTKSRCCPNDIDVKVTVCMRMVEGRRGQRRLKEKKEEKPEKEERKKNVNMMVKYVWINSDPIA